MRSSVRPNPQLYPFHHIEIDDTPHHVYSEWRAVVAELLGTMLFVFISSAAAVATNTFTPWREDDIGKFAYSVLPIALANGLAFGSLVWSLYHLSGAHLNPAITWAALITRRVGFMRGLAYIIAQVVGGIFGALLASAATPAAYHGRLGSHFWNDTLSNFNGFLLEMMLTLVLVFVVFATLFDPVGLGRHSAFAIGSTVTFGFLVGWVFVGPPMNPARALGTAIVYGTYDHMWVYWLAPLTGATLAALIYTVLFLTRPIVSPLAEERLCGSPSGLVNAPTVPSEHSRLIHTTGQATV